MRNVLDKLCNDRRPPEGGDHVKKFGIWVVVGSAALALAGGVMLMPGEAEPEEPELPNGPRLPDRDYSQAELESLARLVHAEARGEPMQGKIGIANVVVNRSKHSYFPDGIQNVIYQQEGGRYQFCPVEDGSIDNEPSDRSLEAARVALEGRHVLDEDVVYFYNPETAQSGWIRQRPVEEVIGSHAFAH